MLISVITASYNYEEYIKETIQSVINQTYKDWELIIVDDGSSDNSVEVIKSYCQKDNRIKLYRHEGGVNKGLAETIKFGLSKASGDWVAFLESDDKFMPEYLEEKVKIIKENPEVKLIFSDFESFEGEGIDKTKYYQKFKRTYRKSDLSFDLLKQNWICTFSIVMLKKELLSECNFDSPIPALLDWWLWVQIAQKTKFYYLDKKLTMWRIHTDSFINRTCFEKMDNFYDGITRFYDRKNIRAQIFIFFRKLKRIREKFVRIKFGKDARLLICGKIIYQNKKIN